MLKNYNTIDTDLISELDLNNDNILNSEDFTILKDNWGILM